MKLELEQLFNENYEDTLENKTVQEIMLVCMTCGTQKPTGTYTPRVNYDERYAYSHGYCSIKCAIKQYPDIANMFTEYDNEKW